jgi:hypothetical protein
MGLKWATQAKRLNLLTVKATNIVHGNLKNAKVQRIVDGTTSASSDNWSGYAVTDASGTFEANDSYVYSEWTVPAVGIEEFRPFGPPDFQAALSVSLSTTTAVRPKNA